jgi:hypothetical protein
MGDDIKFATRHPSLLLPYTFHTMVEIYQTVLFKCKLVD